MAQKVTTTLVDDLDGTPIEEGKGETIKFALDNTSFEIDLNEANAKKFRKLLTDYVTAARVSGRSTQTRSSAKGSSNKEELFAIRIWANENGHTVSSRGRVPQAIIDEYKAAH